MIVLIINDARKRKVTSGSFLLTSGNFFKPFRHKTGMEGCKFMFDRGLAIHGVLRMKSRDSLIRLKEFQVNEKRRQLQQLQLMMSEFERMAKELVHQITLEENKSGITDPSHFAYPTFAKAARQRADNLQVSIRELKTQQETAEAALEEVQAEYAKAAALESRDGALRARA
jgi:flagellar export protein FliJ